jgi:hypothetical protein
MDTTLTIEIGDVGIHFDVFDNDKELQILVDSEYGTKSTYIYLTPNQINEVITHLAKQLQEVGEPIDFLQKSE